MTKSDIELKLQLMNFKPVPAPHPDMIACVHSARALSLLVTIEDHSDGKKWVHISIAGLMGPGQTLTWDDLVFARDCTVGKDKKAIQVLPPEKEHVNVLANCFHLFHCLGEDPLPDFTRGKGIL
jgi:hypothetical protein